MKNAAMHQPRPVSSAHDHEDGWRPDFRVSFSSADGWEVAMVSDRAQSWARQHLHEGSCENSGPAVTTDLAGINKILRQARSAGYRSEYVGPHEIVRL